MGDFGVLWELGFEVLELGFEDLRLGFGNLVLGFEDGGLGFEVLREERGVLSSEAGWLEGVRVLGARFACLGGCSRNHALADKTNGNTPSKPAPKPDRPTDRPKRWAKSHITEARSHEERTSRNTYFFARSG